MLQSQFNFVNIMIQPLDQATNCVTVQTKPGQFTCACACTCRCCVVNVLLLFEHIEELVAGDKISFIVAVTCLISSLGIYYTDRLVFYLCYLFLYFCLY